MYYTDQCTSMMNENIKVFVLKFEWNVKVWVCSEHWGGVSFLLVGVDRRLCRCAATALAQFIFYALQFFSNTGIENGVRWRRKDMIVISNFQVWDHFSHKFFIYTDVVFFEKRQLNLRLWDLWSHLTSQFLLQTFFKLPYSPTF